jgi:uncharacterized membrane protein
MVVVFHFTAKLKRSKTAQLVWGAIVLAILVGFIMIWVGSIVYSVVTGEGSGPG